MMRLDIRHIRAVLSKELRDYRRKRSIVVTMLILPLIFLIQPVVALFVAPASTSSSNLDKYVTFPLLYLLLLPVIMPSTLAAYAVAGEREQGTLEPLLSTPIRRQEFILGKAAAVMIPTLVLCYTVLGLFLAAVRLFARAEVASAVFHQRGLLLALVLLTPLVAGWAIVVGMAVSVRASEVRVAQQLGILASLPAIFLVVLLAADVIQPTTRVAVEFTAALLAIDVVALRLVSRMFDPERLLTGAKAVSARSDPRFVPSPPRRPHDR
jgi:ABC-type transport system involved in multi-copper enzyme maturation permease subunit